MLDAVLRGPAGQLRKRGEEIGTGLGVVLAVVQVREVAPGRQLAGADAAVAVGVGVDGQADLDVERLAVAVQLAEQDELGAGGCDPALPEPFIAAR